MEKWKWMIIWICGRNVFYILTFLSNFIIWKYIQNGSYEKEFRLKVEKYFWKWSGIGNEIFMYQDTTIIFFIINNTCLFIFYKDFLNLITGLN